jgi:hypothetical protein
MKVTVFVTLAWLSTTPRGLPVLPDVYWMKAVSVSTGVGNAGAGRSTSRSWGSSTWRMLDAAAWLSSTPLRNQPMVTTALACASRKTFAVASTPRVG